jgi:hypothetical protein
MRPNRVHHIARKAGVQIPNEYPKIDGKSGGSVHSDTTISFGPIEKYLIFCDVSVREKDWRSKPSL